MFALLDAADDDGLLSRVGLDETWREIRRRITDVPNDREASLIWALMHRVEQTGVLTKTWILDRWTAIQQQVKRSTVLAEEARHTSPLFRK